MSDANRDVLSETIAEYERDEIIGVLNGKVILREALIRTGAVIGSIAAIYGTMEIIRYSPLMSYFR